MLGDWGLFGYNTMLLVMIIVPAIIAISAWFGTKAHHASHVDTMAGDGGEE